MNVVDSSGWLEFFTAGPNASRFRPAILATADLLVPTIVLLEVERRLRQRAWTARDDMLVRSMAQGRVVPLDDSIARLAARLGVEHRLPTADSIVYATGQSLGATVWTQDSDFESLPGVKYFPTR